MNTPIIDPSILTEEQREAIRKLYAYCIDRYALLREREEAHLFKNRETACRAAFAGGMNQGAMEAMTKLFGPEFFKKGE